MNLKIASLIFPRDSDTDVNLEDTTVETTYDLNAGPLELTYTLSGIQEIFIFVEYAGHSWTESNQAGYLIQSVGCVIESVTITGTKPGRFHRHSKSSLCQKVHCKSLH